MALDRVTSDVQVGHHDVESALGQREGDAAADTSGATGDQRDPARR
jgi:hypothetical protein